MSPSKPALSIIIPTLNEEDYVQIILGDVLKSDIAHNKYEIIVADSGSTDATEQKVAEIKKQYPQHIICFTKAPKRGVSIARNTGAALANGKFLVFLDADSRIAPDFLSQNLAEMQARKLDAAACYLVPDSGRFLDKALLAILNLGMRFFQHTTKPIALGAAIWATKVLHNQINGFDPTLSFGEDMEYVTVAKHTGHVGMLNSKSAIYCMRRAGHEGHWQLVSKTFHCFVYHLFHYSMKGIGVTYQFGMYKKK